MEIYLCFYISLFVFLNIIDLLYCDPCSENKYAIIDDYRRSPDFRSNPSERRLCDNRINHSWYRFKINGSNAEIPTKCIAHGCGTRAPLWLPPPTGGLPPPGKKVRSHACASFEVPGRELKCCGLKFPITVKNCGEFFVYRLRSTKGCDLAYCAEVVTTICDVGQVYVLYLQKCVDIVVEISRPKLHVKKYPDRVSVVCLFTVNNITVSEHKPTFSVTWVKVRNGVSKVIRFKFLSDTRDQVVLGKDVFTGDSVACEVMPVHQTNSQVSEILFLGIQAMESDITLRENGHPETITFISTVPLFCKQNDKKCKLDMVLSVKYPKGNNLSNILLSHCLLEFHPNNRCQGIGCITQQVKVAMTPNLYTLEAKDIHITGYLYVDEHIVWNQDSLETKIKVLDLPSASCFVTAGVFILSFQNSISKISRRGTYVLFKSESHDFEIQIRINSCNQENLLCSCGIAVYYQQTRLTIDTCRAGMGNIIIEYHPAMRANIKIFEGRHGKLIYILLDGKAQLRIDLRQTSNQSVTSMSVTLQVSGFYTDKTEGLCGYIRNDTLYHKNEKQTNQPIVDWRLLPGQSLFENYEFLVTKTSPLHPECDCSMSSYQTSCPKSSAVMPQFLIRLTETTSYWINKTQTPNQIPDYIFDGDFDDDEVVTKQPAKDGQLANDICTNMFMTSGIAKTCLNRINIKIETVLNICVALATSYKNSTWMPEVLRLLENLCDTYMTQDVNRTGDINDLNIDDIRQAILCPEGCYGNGICTENGCFCDHGYSGIECLTKIEEVTTTITTINKPSTKVTKVPSTISSRPTTPPTTSTTTEHVTTTASTTLLSTTTETSTTPDVPVTMVTCDTRSSSCSTVYVDLSQTSGEFALKCYITLVQFTLHGWDPVGTVYTTLLRYVNRTTVECMLPMVTNGDNFVHVYRVQVPNGGHGMLKTELLAVVDGHCQMCDINGGCMLKINTCFINKKCYRHLDINHQDVCLQCISLISKNTWSPRTENLPPLLQPDHSTIAALEGDIIKMNISVTDPEQMDMYYSTVDNRATVSTVGEFTWHVGVTDDDGLYRFVINVTDSCGAFSIYILTVVVKSCECENGGVCKNQVVTKNRTDYSCNCLPSFTGKLCEVKINSCHSNPCFPGVSCTEMSDSYKCGNCIHGYQGDGVTCTKTCSSQPCFPGVVCTNLIGPSVGFACGSCPKYFYGNGEKCYRNEDKACNEGICSPLVSCEEISDYPGYRCGNCPHGYMGNGTLCKAFCFPPCKAGKECTQPGICGCREGYTGAYCNQAICRVACQNGGICYQPDKCFCIVGYTGKYCEKELCPHGCMNGASCIDVNTCACLPGYRGHRCEIESCSISCLNGGTCVGFNRCRCTPEYKGIFCEQAVCIPDCINNGVCVRPGVCYCPIGFYGQQCENVFCYPPCKSGGYCLAGNQCHCQPGFTGSYCQFTYCWKNVCQNGGHCVGPDLCACRSGWEGKYCRRPTCHLGCQNGGYCYLPNRCRCQPGYWGPFCQFPSCYPPCSYGGRCTGQNHCSCRKYYTGKYCMRRKR